jgi:hypothetical protein
MDWAVKGVGDLLFFAEVSAEKRLKQGLFMPESPFEVAELLTCKRCFSSVLPHKTISMRGKV